MQPTKDQQKQAIEKQEGRWKLNTPIPEKVGNNGKNVAQVEEICREVDFVFVLLMKEEIRGWRRAMQRRRPVVSNNSAHNWTPMFRL